MHYQGARFMYYTDYYMNNGTWTDVGSVSSRPNDLIYTKAYNKGNTLYGKTTYNNYLHDFSWFFGNHRPGYGLYYDNYWNNYQFLQTTARIFSNATENYSIYNTSPSGSNGTGGNPYGTRYLIYDNEYVNYYTLARQGRFMFWGYKDVPTYSYFTSYPIFINAVGILHNYY